ncbi:hypothetical protein [Streptomyces sp. NPDC002088]|uniref:hypothetical protein n=1 Tax=Streptomyces sp. NPDC002088 TaxID=3154665 RepID=UPI0033338DE3
MSIITEAASEHEASYRYLTDDEGDAYVSVKDVVGSLLEFADKLQGLGGIQQQIGDAFTQVAVQLAEPFMDIERETVVLTLHTSPLGGGQ